MKQRTKPCNRCGRPRLVGTKRKTCDQCGPVDNIWPRLTEGPDGCWEYRHRLDPHGYGRVGGQMAYRLTYEALRAEIPAGLSLDHLCQNKACVNPWHLEPVTKAENTRRRWYDYETCANGHPRSGANLYIGPSGKKVCRACGRAATARYLTKKRAGVCREPG